MPVDSKTVQCEQPHIPLSSRQWPEVYDLCHTFLHIVRVRKHTNMRELHAKRVQCSHVRVFSDSRNVQKSATKSDTSGHCLRPAGSGSETVRPSAAATAEDYRCRLPPPSAQAATHMLQPTSNPAAPSVEKSRRKLVVSLACKKWIGACAQSPSCPGLETVMLAAGGDDTAEG